MTGFTVPLGFPYPQPTDPADAPSQIQALAEAVDAEVTDTENQLAAITDPPIAWAGAAPAVIPPSIGTLIVWTIELFDNAGMLDLVTDPVNWTVPSNGLYMFNCEGSFEPNGTGGRQVEILVNGVVLAQGLHDSAAPTTTGAVWSAAASLMRVCTAGEKVSFRVGHTAGVSISTQGCEAQIFRVSA